MANPPNPFHTDSGGQHKVRVRLSPINKECGRDRYPVRIANHSWNTLRVLGNTVGFYERNPNKSVDGLKIKRINQNVLMYKKA